MAVTVKIAVLNKRIVSKFGGNNRRRKWTGSGMGLALALSGWLIARLSERQRKWITAGVAGLSSAGANLLYAGLTYAQAIDTFRAAASKLGVFIQQLGGVSLAIIIPAGFFIFMWGGFSDNQRANGIRVITCGFIGAVGLLLFSKPLADFLVTTFGTGGTA